MVVRAKKNGRPRQREVFRTFVNPDVRWMCGGCAVDMRRTCADIAMSVRVDIVRISYGYADIARISHQHVGILRGR